MEPILKLQQGLLEFSNPNHDRRGRFAPGSGAAKGLAEAGKEPGGATLDRKGSEVVSGYVVSLKEFSHPVPAAEFRSHSVEIVKNWMRGAIRSGALDDPANVLGVWHEGPPDNMVSLDVNRIIPTGGRNAESKARKLGAANDQVAIYHIDSGRVIPTGGSGGYK